MIDVNTHQTLYRFYQWDYSEIGILFECSYSKLDGKLYRFIYFTLTTTERFFQFIAINTTTKLQKP